MYHKESNNWDYLLQIGFTEKAQGLFNVQDMMLSSMGDVEKLEVLLNFLSWQQ